LCLRIFFRSRRILDPLWNLGRALSTADTAVEVQTAKLSIGYLVGAQDVALNSRINLLARSAGHSGALRRNGYLRPAPHPVRLKVGKPEIRKQTEKSRSSFGESDAITELWCERSAMTFGKQASAASRRQIGSPVAASALRASAKSFPARSAEELDVIEDKSKRRYSMGAATS
jgi:hypothetical protein